jgi:hypothetical protein
MNKLRTNLSKQSIVWLIALLFFCCTVAVSDVSPATMIDITVVSAGTTGHPMNGVAVTAIESDGKYVQLGKTDAVGHIHISKRKLRDAGVTALIFCHRTYFCGALIVADRQLLEYDEYLIALAPIAVR